MTSKSDYIELPTAQMTTPVGVAIYPAITNPDTKFDDAGVFSVKLAYTPEQFAPLKAKLDKLLADTTQSCHKQRPKTKAAVIRVPYESELDDTGEQTGRIVINVKTKASGTRKNGLTWKFKLPVFDAHGNRIKEVPSIWGGSELAASFEARGYFVPSLGIGVSLKLNAVQLIKLVSGGTSVSAEACGFGKVEGGYAADVEESFDAADTSDEDEF